MADSRLMGHLDRVAADALVEGLISPDNVVRAQTAQALGTIGAAAEEAAPALVEAMTDSNDRVRAKAVEALGKIGEPAAAVSGPITGTYVWLSRYSRPPVYGPTR